MGDENPVVLTALDKGIVSSEKVIMADFVKWAKENLFYTIVTNYSLQAFNANDYKRERCLVLGNQKSKKEAEDDADGKIWMNSLFHKNDGYMTPIVLNPYRDNGIFDMNKELHLTLYRLSAIMIYAKRHDRNFMEDYGLNKILYTFDADSLAKKYLEDYRVSRDIYTDYRYQIFGYMDLGSKMLQTYGVADCLDFKNKYQRAAAMYLIYKTFSIANSYPSYEEFSDIGELDEFTQQVSFETEAKVDKLVKTILKDHSHISLKIRQTLHFLKALLKEQSKNPDSFFDEFTYDDYFKRVFVGRNDRSMREIQEYLPPSFFTIEILMNRYKNGEVTNEDPIPLEQMSAGERQYLYTFSTYIYHILNLLSIQESHRVKYRNINLILDEVEICFHPEYQRRFVNELLGYIKRLYMNRWASYNIMIATHSPFVLSDIPQGNILYLEDGKMVDSKNFKNPFAANICDILYQSFFLKNGFVGEFARKKINNMIYRLLPGGHFSDKYRLEYELLMNLIGDPFLKMQLQRLFDERRARNEKNRD